MMDRNRKIRICRVLLVLNLCFIWGNSLLPAEASQAFSDGVHDFLGSFRAIAAAALASGALLRKLAHFTEFAALGLLLSWLFALTEKKHRPVLPLGLLVACVDEIIQFFVPGRAPGLLDVAIDTCGVAAGMILLRIGYLLLKRNKAKPFGGKQE